MKSPRYLTALAMLVGLLGITSTAPAAGTKWITVTNNTSYVLTAMFASPSAYSSWDGTTNLLVPGQTVLPGQTIPITIADGIDHCHYDVMGILIGITQYAYQYELDACDGDTWNISAPY